MDIAAVLRENGYKVTPQRLAVYEVVNNNTTHPNAEAIYKELQPKYPFMSLATVYKTMEIFVQKLVSYKYCSAKKMHTAMISTRNPMLISAAPAATALWMWM